MKKDQVLHSDPWQELAESKAVKKVSLAEALDKLKVSDQDAPALKRGMLNQVRKLTKAEPTPKPKK